MRRPVRPIRQKQSGAVIGSLRRSLVAEEEYGDRAGTATFVEFPLPIWYDAVVRENGAWNTNLRRSRA